MNEDETEHGDLASAAALDVAQALLEAFLPARFSQDVARSLEETRRVLRRSRGGEDDDRAIAAGHDHRMLGDRFQVGFDIGGEFQYTGEVYENDNELFGQGLRERRVRRVSDSYPVLINDLPIPAARKLSGVFQRLISTFEYRTIKPYEAGYLANWPAEVYDIPMAEASLDARAQALTKYKRDLPLLIDPVKLLSTSSANMAVESFRLTLLPVWMTELPFNGREHLVLINGMNGTVKSDLP
ncbi:hypothetical protein FBR04_09975, partial [Betaproteobacteria bacterium PRO7]|nr:hypothetical protein [Betaproteobacteria bacterium PRO7]